MRHWFEHNGERRYAEWSPERLKSWAAKIGPNTMTLVEVILRDRSHPEQGFRSCLGIMRLANRMVRRRSRRPANEPS